MRRVLALLAGLAGASLVAATLGFVWFIGIASRPAPAPPHADGIVALTGGADRVETALHLLAEGHARKLLVSGTGGNAELATLARRAGLDPLPIAGQVTLGRDATTTRGNAEETAAWAKENAIHSLIVVTAHYHMPRALIEIARAAPELTLYPMPVTPHALNDGGSAARAARFRLLAEEYVKFLAASLDLTALVAVHRPHAEPPAEAPSRDESARQNNARATGAHAG